MLTPDRLHAVVSRLFSNDVDHHAPRKAFTIRPLELEANRVRLPIGIVDDEAVGGFLDCVERSEGRFIFGRTPFAITSPPTLLDLQTWDRLADEADSVSTVELEFLSPTFFRRGDSDHLLPSPSVVFGHLRSRWRDVFGVAPHCELDDRSISVQRIDVRSAPVTVRRKPRLGLVGTVRYDLRALTEPERAAIDAFARLAPFAGCGSATTFGCGATAYRSSNV